MAAVRIISFSRNSTASSYVSGLTVLARLIIYGACTTISSIPCACAYSHPASIFSSDISFLRVFCGAPVYNIKTFAPYEAASFADAKNISLPAIPTWQPSFISDILFFSPFLLFLILTFLFYFSYFCLQTQAIGLIHLICSP